MIALSVVGTSYRDGLILHASVPPDARPTGHRHGSIAIYVSPSDQERAIYERVEVLARDQVRRAGLTIESKWPLLP